MGKNACLLNVRTLSSIHGHPRLHLKSLNQQPYFISGGSSSNRYSDLNSSPWSAFKTFLAALGIGVSVGVGICAFRISGSSTQAYCHDRPPPTSSRFNFIAEAVEKAAPSVVYIEVAQKHHTFFGDLTTLNTASGFVVENGQYVLTNAHVVHNAHSVDVKLNSGQIVKGQVTDVDEVADLAIVKLDLPVGITVPPLKFGDSDNLRPGEWVIAMGSPLSLTNTITCGIVSCHQRPSKDLGLSRNDIEYVQTDAAITVGNSGGPLVNLDGDVVGINTMTAGPGISFAIPSSVAQNFVRSANKNATQKFTKPESSRRYMIGVSMLTLSSHVTPTIQHFFYIPKDVTEGVLLTKVWQDSPAYNAGLMRGDVIVRINGKNIKSSKDMYEMVKSGKRLSIEFYRKTQYMKCTVDPEPI